MSNADAPDPELPYLVVTADSSRELALCVSAAMGRGWKLSGGVAIALGVETYESRGETQSCYHERFAQAMVRA